MTRTVLGSRWRNIPLLVRYLMLPSTDPDERLECDTCGATWDRSEGFPDNCKWCTTALDNQRRWQAELVLAAPDIDPNDCHYGDIMAGWAERLAVSVQAELVPRSAAELAWKRAVIPIAV